MRFLAIFLAAALCLFSAAERAHACGGTERCVVDGGYYLAAPPPDWDGESALPLIVYFHGWNASPEGTFRNTAMIAAAHRRGALFVAPYAQVGYWRQMGDDRAEGGRDERAYIHAVMDDINARWPIDAEKTLASGFSRGGSMAWNVACYAGDLFRGYAPIAGGFWRSNPDDCPTGPVNLRHIHGLSDTVVAFDDVGVYNSMPIPEGMTILRRLNGCRPTPDRTVEHARYRCETWDSCDSGRVLELCLHPKGHSIPAEWVAEGFDWLAALED